MFKMNKNTILALFESQMLVEHVYIDVVNAMTTLVVMVILAWTPV